MVLKHTHLPCSVLWNCTCVYPAVGQLKTSLGAAMCISHFRCLREIINSSAGDLWSSLLPSSTSSHSIDLTWWLLIPPSPSQVAAVLLKVA